MNRHRQWLFLLAAAACLTTAKVPSPASETSEIILSSQRVSRTEPPRSEPPRSEPPYPGQVPPSQGQRRHIKSRAGEPSSRSQLSTRCELTTRTEPPTRVERSTSAPSSGDAGDEYVNESAVSASTSGAVPDRLRDQVLRLTNELSKAVAALNMAQQRERKLAVLDREKYSYVKAATEKVQGLVDNVQHAENGLSADTYRERQVQQRLARTHRTQNRSRRRLQVIRRLLAGAEVGLVHLESNRMLSACHSDVNRKLQNQRPTDNTRSRNCPADE